MRKLLIFIGLISCFALMGQGMNVMHTTSHPITSGASGSDDYGSCAINTSDTYITTNNIWYYKVSITTGGTVSAITVYCGNASGNPDNTKVAIYSDNSDDPGSLVTNSASIELTSLATNSDNALTFSIDPSVSNSSIYWVALKVEGNQYLKEGAGSVPSRYESATYGDAFPSTATPIAYPDTELKICVTVDH